MGWCVLMELWLLHWVYIDLMAPKTKYICNNNFTVLKSSTHTHRRPCICWQKALVPMTRYVHFWATARIVLQLKHRCSLIFKHQQCNVAVCELLIVNLMSLCRSLKLMILNNAHHTIRLPHLSPLQIQFRLKQNWKIFTFSHILFILSTYCSIQSFAAVAGKNMHTHVHTSIGSYSHYQSICEYSKIVLI